MVCTQKRKLSANWVAILALTLLLCPLAARGQNVTLLWDPSPSPGVVGYMVYSWSQGTNFDSIDAGSNTTVTITGLKPGTTNLFEVAAYGTNEVESPPSNLIEYYVPLPLETLTLQANPGNAGSLIGGGTFTQGTSVTVIAAANTGYAFSNWTENGVVQSSSPIYSFDLATNRNLVANFSVTAIAYNVAAQPNPANGGNVSGAGTFASGSPVTVTATPNSGYVFTNWTENGIVQSISPDYNFTLAANRNLVANFALIPVTYTASAQANPVNAGNVSGGGTFASGSLVTLTATANSGYTFANWTLNGMVQSTSPSYSFTLTTNCNLAANFTANPVTNTVGTLVSPVGAGSVAGGGAITAGSSVTLTATANSGYTFTNWTLNGVVQSTSPNYTFTPTASCTLVANFTANYTVATQIVPANAGNITGGGIFSAGSSVTVTATANSGYTFTNWTENGVVQSAYPNYTFTLASNRNLVANFTLNAINYTVATQTVPANAGNVIGGGTFAAGSSVTVSATANNGYTFTNWTENGVVQSTYSNYNFTLATNRNLVANFTANPVTYTLGTQSSPANGGSATGGGTFAAGSSVTVMAAANSGYTFTNWTLNGVVQSTSPSYNFTLNTNCNLVANFTANPAIFTVSTQIDPTNAGTVTGDGRFVAGSFVTVTAEANEGYTFTNWTENGIELSTATNYSFTLTTNRNLVANFTVNPGLEAVAVQASPANAGSVIGGGTFTAGSSVTVTATANSGYTFANWTWNGVLQSTTPVYTFTLATNCTLVANFTVNPGSFNVATLIDPTNAGSVTGGGTFVAGTLVTVTAEANEGYTFTNWTENGTELSTSTNYSFTLTTNRNLVANFITNPVTYSVDSQVFPVSAGSVTGDGTFIAGSEVTVTATANSGYTFANWMSNSVVVSTLPTYTFTLSANCALEANFTINPVSYSVASQVAPANAGNVVGGGTFVAGSAVTVTATANSGYTFSNWTENGIVQCTFPNYTFTLATNRNLVANFTANATNYAVATQVNPANAGSVVGGGTFAAGSSVTVTATANSGYTFTNWTENGVIQSTYPNYNFTLATNRNLVANFTANPIYYTVTPSAGTNGSISPSGPQTVLSGSSVAFTAVAATNYQISQWMVNGAVVQNGGASYTLQNVTNNSAVTVSFVASLATVSNSNFAIEVNGKGTVSPNLKSFRMGTKYTVTAIPSAGNVFSNWVSNGVIVSTATSYTFVAESNILLTANFIPNPFIQVEGSYNGLFYDTNGVAEESSGSVTATVTSSGGYSARILLGSLSYSFSGQFSLTGAASKSITRPRLSPLNVQLQLGSSNSPMTGTISDGVWTATLEADPAVYSTATTHHAPQAGRYTFIIPGNINGSAPPGGNGIGTVTVNTSGHVSLSGTLGDGTPISASSVVGGDGQWPFYASLYGGSGSILGWLCFTNYGDIAGQIAWFKQPQKTAKLYPGGFTNSTEVIGSIYTYTPGFPVLGYAYGLLSLVNGDLTQDMTDQITLWPEIQAVSPNTKLTVNASTGLFTGSVINPATDKPIPFNGVILQNQDFGAGLFLGPNESGSVFLLRAQ
jgi:hypothetical protein